MRLMTCCCGGCWYDTGGGYDLVVVNGKLKTRILRMLDEKLIPAIKRIYAAATKNSVLETSKGIVL